MQQGKSSEQANERFKVILSRTVTQTIHQVISACLNTPKMPTLNAGRIECDQAIQEMERCKILLEQSHHRASNNSSYFEALDQVVENSKRLGEAMTHIASAAKNVNHALFYQAVQDASWAVTSLVESSAQVTRLVDRLNIKDQTLS
jgi:talin